MCVCALVCVFDCTCMHVCVCLCVCVCVCRTCFLGQEDFTLHLYSVQKAKETSATPKAARLDPAKSSESDELNSTSQESELIFDYMESND